MNTTHDAVTAELLTPAIFEAFRQFINQRPSLDPCNYFSDYRDKEGRRAYRQESRRIQADGRRARAALALASAYPFDGAALLDACRAYSGRLSIVTRENGLGLDYCTGQYWPTEYRTAAAVVLERYAETIRPKTISGQIPRSIAELKEANRAAGGHFFDRDTMRFFNSKILPNLYTGPGGVFFVTSEAQTEATRAYSVRTFNPKTANVNSFGEFNKWTRAAALKIARECAAAAVPICHNCGGSGSRYDQECWHCHGTKTEPQPATA